MRRLLVCLSLSALLFGPAAHATIFGQVRGIVHDPQHRPVADAQVVIQSVNSSFSRTVASLKDGSFSIPSVPLGNYTVTVTDPGFSSGRQALTLVSDTSLILHFELQIGSVGQTVTVDASAPDGNVNTATPTILISREDIAATPGADRTNSLAMITDYVPGAYMTHDMLHMRGGHQVSWLLDGVEIPNTNIASNLGAQIDPKDIDYVEVQRGSYTSDVGDRTYGVFNVVPRNGFERNRLAELVISAGSFLQTNDQLSFGDHSEKLAYYVSLNGNRSEYGLAPPTGQVFHDASNGYGGFSSFEDNRTSKDQFRLVTQLRGDSFQIPYDPDPNDYKNQLYDSSGLRDSQHEIDGVVAFSWLHTFNSSTVLQASPFFHYNRADYKPGPNDQPVATTSDRASTYAGGEASIGTTLARNTLQAGLYSFGQHDNLLFAATFNDGSASTIPLTPGSANGGVMEAYVSDNYKATSWLTLIAGLRETLFQGSFTEDDTDPRFGLAVSIPKLNWVFRAAYDRYYQPPPLLTVNGPLLQYAQGTETGFAPLHGERDEEHQFGVQIPYHGWLLDIDTFKNRVDNFLDHSNVGESSIYFPVTVQGVLVRAWETTLRSPSSWRFGQLHLAYSNQIAEQRGAISGGLVCYPIGSVQCDAGYSYTPLDHDQRNTLNLGFSGKLRHGFTASTNVYYGSGFSNGHPEPGTPYPNPYLPQHTTFDLAIGKSFGEKINVSVQSQNVANRRVLLDNSLTFGGFHYNDPRAIYAEVRYRFHY